MAYKAYTRVYYPKKRRYNSYNRYNARSLYPYSYYNSYRNNYRKY